jgi:hypothetical protein
MEEEELSEKEEVCQRSQREIDCEGRARERERQRVRQGKSRRSTEIGENRLLEKWAQARHNLHVTVPLRLP